MATYISLVNFTDQGIRNIKESPARFAAFKSMAEKMGVNVKSVHYTVGQYDLVIVAEGSDEAVAAVLLKVGSNGNTRSLTLRAFSLDEMKQIIGSI